MSAPDAVVRLESLAARGRTLGTRVGELVAQAEAAAPVPTQGLVHAEFDASGALTRLQFTLQAGTATQEELEAAVNVAVVAGYRAQPEAAADPRRAEALLSQVATHGLPQRRTVSSPDGRVRVDVVVGRVVAVAFAAGSLGRHTLDEIGRVVVDTCARALADDARGGH